MFIEITHEDVIGNKKGEDRSLINLNHIVSADKYEGMTRLHMADRFVFFVVTPKYEDIMTLLLSAAPEPLALWRAKGGGEH